MLLIYNKEDFMDKDFAFEPVPSNAKKGFWPILSIMIGFTFFSASMLSGGALGIGLEFQNFIISVLVGNLILCIYTSLLAYISSDTGLSVHLLSKYSFGEKGSYLVSILLGGTQVGWFGVGVAMFAIPVEKVTGIPVIVLVMVSGLLMTATAYYGIKSLMILSMIAVPLITILGLWSIGIAIDDVGGVENLLKIKPQSTMTITSGISLCIASFISGGTLTPDFIRFSKNKKIAVISTIIAFLVGNSLMFLFGAIGAMATGQADISEVMFMQGLIIPSIIILGLNIWTTNDNALYASGLGFSNITKLPKNKLVIINGLIGTLFAIILYNNFMGWLTLLNTLMPSIGAIIIADYFIIHKRKYTKLQETNLKQVNVIAILSWVIGGLAAYFIGGIAPINSIIFSMIFYNIFTIIKVKL
ncbi:cytosine permease [Candidatus Epulonipiscioides gigas]|nr:cytosine permease [Epulopiscium sp. SCG-C07WGA-EpuloA2]